MKTFFLRLRLELVVKDCAGHWEELGLSLRRNKLLCNIQNDQI